MEQQDKILSLIRKITEYQGIQAGNIPDIDLYMDQITTFFDSKLESFRRNENDKLLTKTMINNYSKSRIILPPVNKKYSKQHLMIMNVIYQLKQILSLQDIKALSDYIPVNGMEDNDKQNKIIDFVYDMFLQIEKKEFETFEDLMLENIEDYDNILKGLGKEKKSHAEILILIISLIIQANLRKMLAESLIDSIVSPYIKELDELNTKKEPKKTKETEKSK